MDLRTAISLLPTVYSINNDNRKSEGYGPALGNDLKLLPTPTSRDWKGRNQRDDATCLPGALTHFKQYQDAVERWTRVFGTPPEPTQENRNGNRVLNPAFTEWMMGFPRGWVTETGISRTNQLKTLGNAVVPQQGAEALKRLRVRLENEN